MTPFLPPAIVLAHELGHGLAKTRYDGLEEFGAVTFFENPYRQAFGVKDRTTYNSRPLSDEFLQSDINSWNDWSGAYRNATPWKGGGGR